jgi:hypothetical protein
MTYIKSVTTSFYRARSSHEQRSNAMLKQSKGGRSGLAVMVESIVQDEQDR